MPYFLTLSRVFIILQILYCFPQGSNLVHHDHIYASLGETCFLCLMIEEFQRFWNIPNYCYGRDKIRRPLISQTRIAPMPVLSCANTRGWTGTSMATLCLIAFSFKYSYMTNAIAYRDGFRGIGAVRDDYLQALPPPLPLALLLQLQLFGLLPLVGLSISPIFQHHHP